MTQINVPESDSKSRRDIPPPPWTVEEEEDVVEEEALPVYGELPDQIQFSRGDLDAGARVTDDGRVNININTKTGLLAERLVRHMTSAPTEPARPLPPAYIPPSLGGLPGQKPPPRLNVVIQIVGSRGDVQPFLALAQTLRDTYGHRVRLATHPVFQQFVEEQGIEFFNIGGDPAELMAFMVKNPGLMTGFEALKSGEVSRRRRMVEDILVGCWRSCFEAGNGLGPPPKTHARDVPLDTKNPRLPGDPANRPFVADAIIANPPSFAAVHCAERMGIPLHMMFTMPWSPTRAFPHPLANIQSSNLDDVMTNYASYVLVEMITWQGLGDVVNRYRENLGLSPLSLIWAPGLLTRLAIPHTYIWSPSLIPKPNDWGQEIDVCGFFFLDLATSYTPDHELAAFLENGPPPVYIGFGSIVVDDPNRITRTVFDAIRIAGCRALVSKGWGGLGADEVGVPDGVFMLGNVPHDWLFQHVSCVVHHGGAGTTAAGIKAGKPAVVVPFFGDQPFWGAMLAKAGAGPEPIPYKQLTSEKLAAAITYCLKHETLARATELGQKIREEKGTDVGGQSFHNHLDIDKLRCNIAPSRVAVWRVRRTKVVLGALTVEVLVREGLLKYSDVKLYRPKEYHTEEQPWDPISGAASSLVGDFSAILLGIFDVPREVFKAARPKNKKTEAEQGRQSGESVKVSSSSFSLSNDMTTASGSATSLPLSTSSSVAITHTQSTTDFETARPPEETSVQRAATMPTSAPQVPTSPPSPSLKRGNDGSPSSDQATTSPGRRFEAAVATGQGVTRVVGRGVRTPMNFCLGIAKGFRNAPKLYHDDTVRPPEKITDFTSGLKVAGREFGYGLYDGISGLVTQPYRGAEKEGAAGLVKGFAKGIGGLLFKTQAGAWGVPGYAMQGIHAAIKNAFAKNTHNYVVVSRIIQGREEFAASSAGERNDIIARWKTAKSNLGEFYAMKQRETGVDGDDGEESNLRLPLPVSRTGLFHSRTTSLESRRNNISRAESSTHAPTAETPSSDTFPVGTYSADLSPLTTPSTEALFVDGPWTGPPFAHDTKPSTEDVEFERAIRASVAETSRGDREEDARIEAAIRVSLARMRQLLEPLPEVRARTTVGPVTPSEITDEEYQALVERATRQRLPGAEAVTPPIGPPTGEDELPVELPGNLEDERFMLAIQASMDPRPYRDEKRRPIGNTDGNGDDDDDDADDNDDELRRAIEASEAQPQRPPPTEEDDEQLRRAIEQSEAAHREQLARDSESAREESIVLEYVKQQSLAEAEYQRKTAKGKMRENDEEDDEDLKRALEESLKMGGGAEESDVGSSSSSQWKTKASA